VVIATGVGAFFILPYLSFRPVTFAFAILFAIAYLLLRDQRMGKSKLIWLSVPLTVLLANIHLFSFFVPAMFVAMATGELADRAIRFRRYVLLSTLTLLACLATPMLPGLLHTLFFYSAQDRMVSGPVIVEMQSIFRGLPGLVSAIICLAMLACIGRRYRAIPVGHWLCIAAGGLLLLKLGRFAPIFALAICPALAATLPGLSDRLLGRPAIVGVLVTVLLIGSVRVALEFPRSTTSLSAWVNRHGPDTPGYPCDAADFIAATVSPTSGKLINEFSWGGYLAWRLGDQYQVLLDGRTQVYPQTLWQATYLGSAQDRRKFLAGLHADAALVPAGKSWFRPTLIELGWRSVYTDKDHRAEVLLPPDAVAHGE
jgi:hypothetical protein